MGTCSQSMPTAVRSSRRLPSESGHAESSCPGMGRSCWSRCPGSPIAGPGVDESKLPPPDRSADGIGVVDLATHKVVRNYPSGQDPEVFDLSPDGKTLYVSNEDAAQMSVVDLTTGTIKSRAAVGEEPEGVTVTAGRTRNLGDVRGRQRSRRVDAATHKVVATIANRRQAPGGHLHQWTARPHSSPTRTPGVVTVVDVATHKVASTLTDTENRRCSGRATAHGRGAVAGWQPAVRLSWTRRRGRRHRRRRAQVHADDRARRRPPVGHQRSAPTGRSCLRRMGSSGDVSVVDVATGKINRQIKTGGSPWGVVVVGK